MKIRLALVLLAFCAPFIRVAPAQCARWEGGFELPGLFADPTAMFVYDDGSGSKLYCVGSIYSAGDRNVRGVARWDGIKWDSITNPAPNNGGVSTAAVFDDGTGPALFCGGNFTQIGGVAAHNIAKWNGTSWSPLSSGVDNVVRALAVFDDGSGPALYAGGWFVVAGGNPALAIARWNGTTWSALGSGITTVNVQALAVFDDGSGPALYMGGVFTHAGGVAVHNIARWSNGAFSDVGGGTSSEVDVLCVHDDGSGPALYAGGALLSAGNVAAGRIARWQSGAWSSPGIGFDDSVSALRSFDDGSGSKLYAAGRFLNADGLPAKHLARWDGSAWSHVGQGTEYGALSMCAFDDGLGSGAQLFVAADAVTSQRGSVGLSRWTGASLVPLIGGEGLSGVTSGPSVAHALTFDDGTGGGNELWVLGSFDRAGGEPIANIARWNGWQWRGLPTGVSTAIQFAVPWFDGTSNSLYAIGPLGSSTSQLARWNGTGWTILANAVSGSNGRVEAMLGFTDSSGSQLYVAGDFYQAGTTSFSNHITRWNGSTWSDVGSGLNRPAHVLCVWDDGTGPALYVGGRFSSAGGAGANSIARFQNNAWSPLGNGIGGGTLVDVYALAAFDDGSGPALYAGGNFGTAGGSPALGIARWHNGAWSSVGGGIGMFGGTVQSLFVHDDGTGPALYAGGSFSTAGGQPANGIARWDGVSWSALGSGLSGYGNALVTYDDGHGSSLFVGGAFITAGGAPSYYIAQWRRPPFADCNHNGIADSCDIAQGTSLDADNDGVPDECEPSAWSVVCAGDGFGTLCPCGALGALHHGCPNSLFPRGAELSVSGRASVSADTLVLAGSDMPNASALYFQGTQRVLGPDGAGVVFGDGLRCAGGTIVRMSTKLNAANASSYPGAGDPPVSVRGMVPALGGVRVYQIWYRNPAPGFCTAATFNLTNGIALRWEP